MGKPEAVEDSPTHPPPVEGNDRILHEEDILHAMQLLGHKKIENNLMYVQLVKSIFQEVIEHYVCKVAKNTEEARQLIELGCEYVTGEYRDGGKLFRKKKLLYLRSTEL